MKYLTAITLLCSWAVSFNAAGAPPVARDGKFVVTEDTAYPIDVVEAELASDPDGNDTFYVQTIPTLPTNGRVAFAGQLITYTPNENYVGSDSFVYKILDSLGGSASGTIYLDVQNTPDAPRIPNPDLHFKIASVPVGQTGEPLRIGLGKYVVDPDLPNDQLTVQVSQQPSSGKAGSDEGFGLVYYPNSGFVGTDKFTYVVTDSTGEQATGTVTVVVDQANTAPTAQNVNVNAGIGQTITIPLAQYASDPDGDTLTVIVPAKTPHGSASVSGLNITYVPDEGYRGSDTFSYTVEDIYGGSETATINVFISAVEPQATELNIEVQGDATRIARLNDAAAVSVRVTDETGQPLAEAAVSWAITEQTGNTPITPASEEPTTDGDGIARMTFPTSNKPTTYNVDVTVAFGELQATATTVVATGLNAITRPNTPEGAIAGVLDVMCPALEQLGGEMTSFQQLLVARCNELFDAATSGNDARILSVLRAISPEETAAQARTSNGFGQQQLGNIGARLAALRGGARGFALSGLAFNIKGQTVPGSVLAEWMDPDARGGGASADGGSKWSAFITGSLGGGDKDRTTNEEGFDFRTDGLTGGMDYRFSTTTVFGAALGYAHSAVDLNSNGGELDARGVSMSLYGTYYASQALYFDAVLNYASNQYDQERNIVYTVGPTTVNRTARSDPDGRLLALSIGGGYEIAFKNGSSVEGSLRLRYLDTTIDSYSETGAAELNLHIEEQNTHLFSSSLGTRASWPLSFKWGVVVPQMDLSWEHDIDGGAHTIKGNFVHDQFQNTFAFKTEDPDRDYFNLGFGASAIFPGGSTAFVQHQYTLGRDNFSDWNIALGGRIELPW